MTSSPAAFSALALASTATVADSAMAPTRRDTRTPSPSAGSMGSDIDPTGLLTLSGLRALLQALDRTERTRQEQGTASWHMTLIWSLQLPCQTTSGPATGASAPVPPR